MISDSRRQQRRSTTDWFPTAGKTGTPRPLNLVPKVSCRFGTTVDCCSRQMAPLCDGECERSARWRSKENVNESD